MGDRLAIWLYGMKVATVEQERRRMRLQYTGDAIRSFPVGTPLLSLQLAVRQERFPNGVVHSFLDGLLPEEDSRRLIAQDLGLRADDTFALARALGRDCAGALVFQADDEQTPPPATTLTAEPLDLEEIAHLVENLRSAPLGVDQRVRISLAGVQEKLLLTRLPDGRWGRPVDGTPSTHILKPEIRAYPQTVENEAFCMRVAKNLGMDVADVETISIGGRQLIVVSRYDRVLTPTGEVERVHQEDFCQATGMLPAQKYEEDGGPSLRKLAGILSEADPDSLESLLKAMTLNLVIGNGDAHAKNFSLLHDRGGVLRLAPLYDLLSTLVYGDDRLAMCIDNVHRTSQLTFERLVNEAARWGLSRTRAGGIVSDLLACIPEAVKRAESETPGTPVRGLGDCKDPVEQTETQRRRLRSSFSRRPYIRLDGWLAPLLPLLDSGPLRTSAGIGGCPLTEGDGMFRNSLPGADMPRAFARRLAAGLLGMSLAVVAPTAAQATNLFTLGSKASTSAIVTEASGTGYASWVQTNPADEQEVVFCKIPRGDTCTAPIALPLPSGTYEEIIQPFPVLGSHAGVVYVVGPRYIKDGETLIWTSTDGGATFSAAKSIHSASPDKTGVGDVLLDPNTPASAGPTEDYFGMAFNNPGLGFGFTANEITSGTTSFTFASPGAGGVASSTLGYVTGTIEDTFTKKQIHPEIEAYYNLSSPAPETFFYRYYAKGGNVDGEESGWEGPFKVSDGYVPRLASGPKGLFMLSTDIGPGESLEAQPSAVDVRKFDETTHTFGAPVQIAKIPTSAGTLFNSGDIYENPETGFLYVAQPVINGAGEYVMRLWESTNGGESFTGEREIATINGGYSEIPRLAVAADGQGWLTFNDAGGLEVANLNTLPAPVSRSTPPPPPPPPPAVSSLTIPNQTDQVNGKGDLSVVVDCSSVKCTGDLELLAKFKKTTGKGKKKKTKIVVQTIGTASFNSLALGVDTLSIKLNNRGESLLAIDGYKLSSTASASYLSGSLFKTATGTVRLKGHKPSKKSVLKVIKLEKRKK